MVSCYEAHQPLSLTVGISKNLQRAVDIFHVHHLYPTVHKHCHAYQIGYHSLSPVHHYLRVVQLRIQILIPLTHGNILVNQGVWKEYM